ncbi:nuclear transport factor 2 family protein [Rhodococcus sp. NPDC003322]
MTSPDLIRAGVTNYLAYLQEGDAAKLTALFAEDGVIEDPEGSVPKAGTAAIRAHFDLASQSELRTSLLALRITDSSAAAFFRVISVYEGQTYVSSPIDTFTFDDNGLITYMRAYWGEADYTADTLAAQLAKDVAETGK